MEPDVIQYCTSITLDSVPECDPAWKTETVLALAQGILHEQAFDRLPILADALEEAGCQNQDVLSHCRCAVDHLRSCWVIHWLILRDRIAANYQRILHEQNSHVRHVGNVQYQDHLVDRRKRFLLLIVLGVVGVGLPGLILTLLMVHRDGAVPPQLQPVMPLRLRDLPEFQPLRHAAPDDSKYRPLIQELKKTVAQMRDTHAAPPELSHDVTPAATVVQQKMSK